MARLPVSQYKMPKVYVREDELYPCYFLEEEQVIGAEPVFLFPEELEFVKRAMVDFKIAQRILREAVQEMEGRRNG